MRDLISLSGTIRFCSRSTRNIFPGCRRPFWKIWPAGKSITPVSEAMTIMPSRLIVYRAGLRPPRLAEERGFPSLLDDHGLDLLEVDAEQLRFDDRLPGAHPVDVPPQRVDLPVMRQEPERVGEVPRGKGVRAVPLVNHREGACEGRVSQVREERGELGAGGQALGDA